MVLVGWGGGAAGLLSQQRARRGLGREPRRWGRLCVLEERLATRAGCPHPCKKEGRDPQCALSWAPSYAVSLPLTLPGRSCHPHFTGDKPRSHLFASVTQLGTARPGVRPSLSDAKTLAPSLHPSPLLGKMLSLASGMQTMELCLPPDAPNLFFWIKRKT